MEITLILPDGKKLEVEKGITCLEAAGKIGSRLAKDAIAVKLDDNAVDLSTKIEQDAKFEVITFSTKEGRDIFWHSTAHTMAEAIMNLFPGTLPTIGPPIDFGFFYDFDKKTPFSQEDLRKIEEEMAKIIREDKPIARKEFSTADAKKLFAGEHNNPYKVQLIDEKSTDDGVGGNKVSVYYQGDWYDLCRGPHVPSTGRIKAFKLTKVSGAFWKADSKNQQLQRIYGVSFPDKKMLDEYVKQQEEAEKRDHKKLGKEMELFMQSEMIGKGLPVWLPKGNIIKEEIENYAKEMERKAGFLRVSTPHLAKKELYLTSGHLPYYAESMYPPMKLDDGTYYLKAMNCPHHHLIYKHKSRSYRDLPLRIAEYGTVYRNELSGALAGLLRVRMLSMNDAHIYCTKEQIEQEFENVVKMNVDYFNVFGFKDYYFRLSLHDAAHKEKYIDEPENWEFAEDVLRKALIKLNAKFIEAKDEAAFYGPKVDIQYKAVTGREETVSTIQLDFAAKTKFQLTYADKDGKENNEVYVIHRAPLSTHERFTAFLIEHFSGKFPLWLSPEQARILTIADRFNDYAGKIRQKYFDEGIRAELDTRSESISYKVREAQLDRVNYILVVGEKEVNDGTVNVRTRDNKILGPVKADKFLSQLKEEIKEKKK